MILQRKRDAQVASTDPEHLFCFTPVRLTLRWDRRPELFGMMSQSRRTTYTRVSVYGSAAMTLVFKFRLPVPCFTLSCAFQSEKKGLSDALQPQVRLLFVRLWSPPFPLGSLLPRCRASLMVLFFQPISPEAFSFRCTHSYWSSEDSQSVICLWVGLLPSNREGLYLYLIPFI